MKFFIEQIAINPANPIAAERLLADMGAVEWARDHVTAEGKIFGQQGANEADLAFNYSIFNPGGSGEFEILNYTNGKNWLMAGRGNGVSHLGMHCAAEELVEWRKFFAARDIAVAQEVMTQQHTNPKIKDQRWYNYVIFDTKSILGVDLKFIVRLAEKGTV